ncbi:hypothetical protein B7989_02560 [Fibrobacter sp. UWB5]|nr:hypothetical protein B7989_02560 [Fibrobacter sp. UWB5]
MSTALVTIAPYLLTFEKGQGITRGLFEYGVFAVLLFYVCLKRTFGEKKWFVALFYVLLVALSWVDLLTILTAKKSGVGYYGLIPFVSCLVALALLKDVKGISVRNVNLVLFVSFFAHFGAMRIYPDQPLMQFSVPLYMAQSQQSVDRMHIPESIKSAYDVTHSVSVTKDYVDTTRSNVVVLVESWGIPMDSAMFAREMTVFGSVLQKRGVHARKFSRTYMAEREDLMDTTWRDSTGQRDTLFMPSRFAQLGYLTSFFFGGDSTVQWRYKYIRNIGFQEAFWTDSATTDNVMAGMIDSLLSLQDTAKHFIAWTTRDTRFPISEDAAETERLYFERLFGTLQAVADLAKKHPEVRFVVQGDHEPILAPMEFQRKFYRHWVPYVVLN